MRNIFARSFLALALGTTLSATAFAASEEFLIRSDLANPSVQDIEGVLGVPVAKVELVQGTLYKVTIEKSELKGLGAHRDVADALKSRVANEQSGAVTRIQRNFKYRITMDSNAWAKKLARLGNVTPPMMAEDNPAVEAPSTSPARGPDPKMSSQWGLTNSRTTDAWATQRGDREFIVAVIDTGIDYNHEDLRSNLWRNEGEIAGNNVDDDGNGYVDDVVGYDFAKKDALPYDMMSSMRIDGNPGHGTHCSGVVAAAGNNALGISGVAPNVRVMGLRFITEAGEGTTADATLAINYAVKMGAKVLSNSWGGEKDAEDDTELKAAITAAGEANVLLIFAAGNGRNGVGYDNDSDAKPIVPSTYDHANIVSVAATDNASALGAFSNWGKTTVDLAAPGVTVMSTVPDNGYEEKISLFGFPIADWSGTSMATPHVAGAAALIWSQHPELTALEVKERLLSTVTPVAALSGKVVSGGTLNVEAALR